MVTSSFSDSIVFAVYARKTAFSNRTVFKSFRSGERFRIDLFSALNKTVSFSFENGVVWTGSEYESKAVFFCLVICAYM